MFTKEKRILTCRAGRCSSRVTAEQSIALGDVDLCPSMLSRVHPATPSGWITSSNLPSSSAEVLPPTAHSFRGLHVCNEPLHDLVFLLSHYRGYKDFIHNPSPLRFNLLVCQETFVISLVKTGQPVLTQSAHSEILVGKKGGKCFLQKESAPNWAYLPGIHGYGSVGWELGRQATFLEASSSLAD